MNKEHGRTILDKLMQYHSTKPNANRIYKVLKRIEYINIPIEVKQDLTDQTNKMLVELDSLNIRNTTFKSIEAKCIKIIEEQLTRYIDNRYPEYRTTINLFSNSPDLS